MSGIFDEIIKFFIAQIANILLLAFDAILQFVLAIACFLLDIIGSTFNDIISIDTNSVFVDLFFTHSEKNTFTYENIQSIIMMFSFICVFVFGLYKLFTCIGKQFNYSDESPIKLFFRIFLGMGGCLYSYYIFDNIFRPLCASMVGSISNKSLKSSFFAEAILNIKGNCNKNITNKIISSLLDGFDPTLIISVLGSAISLFAIYILWRPFLQIIMEGAERCVIFNILCLFFPFAWIAYPPKSTANIFSSYIRMIFAEGIVLFSNVLFFKMSIMGISHMANYDENSDLFTMIISIFTNLFLVNGLLKVAVTFDENLNKLGLSTAQSGRGLAMDIIFATKSIKDAFSGSNSSARKSNLGEKESSGSPLNLATTFGGLVGSSKNNAAQHYNDSNPANKLSTSGSLFNKAVDKTKTLPINKRQLDGIVNGDYGNTDVSQKQAVDAIKNHFPELQNKNISDANIHKDGISFVIDNGNGSTSKNYLTKGFDNNRGNPNSLEQIADSEGNSWWYGSTNPTSDKDEQFSEPSASSQLSAMAQQHSMSDNSLPDDILLAHLPNAGFENDDSFQISPDDTPLSDRLHDTSCNTTPTLLALSNSLSSISGYEYVPPTDSSDDSLGSFNFTHNDGTVSSIPASTVNRVNEGSISGNLEGCQKLTENEIQGINQSFREQDLSGNVQNVGKINSKDNYSYVSGINISKDNSIITVQSSDGDKLNLYSVNKYTDNKDNSVNRVSIGGNEYYAVASNKSYKISKIKNSNSTQRRSQKREINSKQ